MRIQGEFTSFASATLDNDGDLEIVTLGFDKRIYALHHDGSMLPGFPPNSYHAQRFTNWSWKGDLADDTWGSPVIVDLDLDGFNDILMPTAEGNFDDRYPGDSGGWTCPFFLPPSWAPGYCGGALYAVDRFGGYLPGYPLYILEDFQSTPALADVNKDGEYEIFIGTGDFYNEVSPDHPTYGFRFYGLDLAGNALPGWEGGKVTGGPMPSSPAIGDIAGDERPEIVISGGDGKIYAYHENGNPVAGFPMTPTDHIGNTHYGFDVSTTAILVDYDGDGKMEIISNHIWAVNIIDGNGEQITTRDFDHDPGPAYAIDSGNLLNAPAVGDIDKDGRLEMVVSDSNLYVWELENSTLNADWPMFKRDAERRGIDRRPWYTANPERLSFLTESTGQNVLHKLLVMTSTGPEPVTWQATVPNGVSVSSSTGTILAGQSKSLVVSISTSGKPAGHHQLGNITIKATIEGDEARNSPTTHPVSLFIGETTSNFLPLSTKK